MYKQALLKRGREVCDRPSVTELIVRRSGVELMKVELCLCICAAIA